MIGIIDSECVICGGLIENPRRGTMTCGPECSYELSKIRRKQSAMRQRGEKYEEDEASRITAPRRCVLCRSRLSLYNRGRYCNPCWTGLTPSERHRIGGRG